MTDTAPAQKTILVNEDNLDVALSQYYVVNWIAGHESGKYMQLCTYSDGSQDILYKDGRTGTLAVWSPVEYWEQGGPIIEREKIWTQYDHGVYLWYAGHKTMSFDVSAQTLLMAAMRAYCTFVIKRAGSTGIEIPAVLWLPNMKN